jgi:adenosylhomocysteine nucleosidase
MTISKYTIGIISPAFESLNYEGHVMENEKILVVSGRTYREGFINGLRVVILGCDMNASAVSLATLSLHHLYHVTHLIYMGFAGAVNEKLKVGDVVLATQMATLNSSLNQEGKDKNKSIEIFMDSEVSNLLHQAAEQVISASGTDPLISAEQELQFKLNAAPVVFCGLVGVGDPFYISPVKKQKALKLKPNLICFEKEGIAVALVGEQYALPVGMIHLIVQAADDMEQIDYAPFITNVASRYIAEITFTFVHLFIELALINK